MAAAVSGALLIVGGVALSALPCVPCELMFRTHQIALGTRRVELTVDVTFQ
jgi:hypothetical protein